MTNLEKLTNVFVETFSIDAEKTKGLEYQSIEAWDSVGHMSLVAAIEDAFDISLDTDDIIDMARLINCSREFKEDCLKTDTFYIEIDGKYDDESLFDAVESVIQDANPLEKGIIL